MYLWHTLVIEVDVVEKWLDLERESNVLLNEDVVYKTVYTVWAPFPWKYTYAWSKNIRC